MSRPIKCRRVDSFPDVKYFKPAGIPLRLLEEICLTVEEVEAVRLKEMEGLDQEQSAVRMNISRPTFQRILTSARHKIADAILNGKAVRIEGGNYEIAPRRFCCDQGHVWDVPYEIAVSTPPEKCPMCNVTSVVPLHPAERACRQGGKRCCEREKT
jgi:uncharacterized protein